MIFSKMINQVKIFVRRLKNKLTVKDKKSVFFYPHTNCSIDGYDILNGESDNVLCLFNDMIRDAKYKDYHFYVLYYHKERLESYKDYCKDFHPERIQFLHHQEGKKIRQAISRCYTVFTDSDVTQIPYRVSAQRIVCLSYFAGLVKNEIFRWEKHGGYKKMIEEQKLMHKLFDYYLSTSEINSKFIALDLCHYYGNFLPFGYPRNDILFNDHSELRKQIENLVGFKFKRIITYVPTHRDYENSAREFFDPSKAVLRSIWGYETESEISAFEKILADTETLVIAKVHPIQQAQTSVISKETSKHVLFYKDLASAIKTSLNPILSISDSIITDYTSAVYDYLYLNRPIIYYFYDIKQYREARGFFIEPIESTCAGHLTYNLKELGQAIQDISEGKDPEQQKRQFLRELFIKYMDNKACERIKDFFFSSQK